MSFKTILLHVNSIEKSEPVIRAGVATAEKYGAHLVGLYVIPPITSYLGVPVPEAVTSFHEKHYSKISEGIRKTFLQLTEGLPITTEWRTAPAAFSSVKNIVSQMAHTSDLLIVGNDPHYLRESPADDLLEAIITNTCRPTLVVPVDHELSDFGDNVLVAWDGTDESTRAIFDSLPLLKLAESVNVHRVNPTGSVKHRTIGTSSEIVGTLARHGISSELSYSERPFYEIAAELFRVATEKEADTIVMGAYGHNKVHGSLIPSVAREVLKSMKIPILMSH